MDYFLSKVTQQAMNYAIRSGVALTASYAIRQSNKLLSNAPKSNVKDELVVAQQQLQHKIRIISPAIDMIELIAARGNTSLESAVSLTKELRLEIQSLGQRLAQAADASEIANKSKLSSQAKAQNELELKLIVADIKQLLRQLENAIPLINLAITTSGASLSTSLPHTVSPSRLLQASTFLTAGDTQYSITPQRAVQIGPTFTLTVYMLFAGHDRPQNEEEIRETTWKEVIHKARVKLRRVPLDAVTNWASGAENVSSDESPTPSPLSRSQMIPANNRADEYAYQIMLIEDFDDDRVHDFEDDQARPGPFDDVLLAGIRETIPVHEISKIFYADTSKVLNIGSDAESNHPVLLLKRDLNAVPPRRMMEKDDPDDDSSNHNHPISENINHDYEHSRRDPWRFPPSLDPEWIAFEVYTESEPEDSESELDEGDNSRADADIESSRLSNSMSNMHINGSSPGSQLQTRQLHTDQTPPWVNGIKTSLSLLELLLRLTSLQQFQQQSHLSITDELLNFFLEESATTGAGGDENYRQALRAEARRRVGWDPYDESPMKRRGEDYQYYAGSPAMSPGATNEGWASPRSPTDAQNGSRPSVSEHARPASPMGSPLVDRERSRGGRASWLRRQNESDRARKGSPLRPSTAHTDEGIGTSPASKGDV
ncbi:Ran-specific GTPase-activating protein 30 [Rhinocladiella similis]